MRFDGSRVRWRAIGSRRRHAASTMAGCVLAVIAASCGGSTPTRPTPPVATPPPAGTASLQVTPGPHVLIVTGNTFNGNCSAIASGVSSIGIAARVTVERDGSGWVARPAGADAGDLVLRFRASGTETAVAVGIAGSATGTLTDANSALGPPAGVRLAVDGQAELAGEHLKGATAPAVLVGEARGTLRFGGPAGPLTTCTRVSWSLGPSAS